MEIKNYTGVMEFFSILLLDAWLLNLADVQGRNGSVMGLQNLGQSTNFCK